ncbi:uncharacterized protein F5891DRAFT_1190370 [Suillus fuscotomentosus]|uniref:ABM domain-containing protein n=1 Tax=Suillus fuscotomentosus TaxID=1912939 RepID=A0AAD4HIH4_9AGAM|nr:uncharacterized protein F5891DRAFT_1190370 [Suillus fuscotomentosus]KAG1898875.1 hypothetical protein F5891DRAFT_1190370 [Suillus fuscotomentosus]
MSTIPTTEIIIFETSEKFREDVSCLRPASDIVSKADGVHKPVYFGLQIENPATGYLFLNWDSLAHHQAFMTSSSYGPLLEALKPTIGGPFKMYHVIFNDHPTFQQPVTEVLLITLKDPSHRAEVFDILNNLSDLTEKKLIFGPTLEDENAIILVGGWSSVEAHWEMVANPEPKAAVERLFVLANKDHLFHTALSSYAGK